MRQLELQKIKNKVMFFKRKKEEREKSKLNELQEKCNFIK